MTTGLAWAQDQEVAQETEAAQVEASEAREYEVHYYVLGFRYTLDSFNRMLYLEYRMDNGLLHDGTPRRNELTVGFRWDFGHK